MATVLSLVVRALESLAVCFREKPLASLQNEIEFLTAELKQIHSFIKDVVEKEGKSEDVRNWLFRVHDVANEAEDVIDQMMIYSSSRENRNMIDRLWESFWPFNQLGQKFNLGMKIANLASRIGDLNRAFQVEGICKASLRRGVESDVLEKTDLWQSACPVIEDYFVGMEERKEKLVSLLVAEKKADNNLARICMFGMGGIGKTTLSKRVYEDSHVRRHFEYFAWATVGQNLMIRNVLESMLLQLSVEGSREDLIARSNLDLAEELFEFLRSKKCLVVLDDVNREAWECLRIAFPSQETSSRLLLTTPCRDVAQSIAKNGIVHEMTCLTEDEGWELLTETAFKDFAIDQEVQEIGKDMDRRCQGLPMSPRLGAKSTTREWKIVGQNIDWYKNGDQTSPKLAGMAHKNYHSCKVSIKIPSILAVAYDALPLHLKKCFLFLGIFPDAAKIKAERSYYSWLRHDTIQWHRKQSSDDGCSKRVSK